jgi:putative hydroxymethylpyrimidine transporter CytX
MFLLWLGAAISISEIFTGGLLAPLGFAKGLAAILIGHVIGVGLLVFGGYISFSRGEEAMESVAVSFGKNGGKIVALCNVAQLVGWTVVMLVQADSAITDVAPELPFMPTALILSVLVLLWALIFGTPAGWLNNITVALLAILCAVLFAEASGSVSVPHGPADSMSMALAIELSIAMPVSWLPLIGDYSSKAEDKTCAVNMPFIGYFIGSVLMYSFGLFIGVTTGKDIFHFIAASPLRFLACGVVLLSTLTTAFLDLYSAAVSSRQLVKTQNERIPILVIGVFAAAVSVFFPAERYGDFLTAFLTGIGMVFVPVYTVLFLDFLTKRLRPEKSLHLPKLLIAFAGMAGYKLFSVYEILIPTLMSIILVCALYIPCIFLRTNKKAPDFKGD